MHISDQASIHLWSAYYPILLSGSSLIVCFWAEVIKQNQKQILCFLVIMNEEKIHTQSTCIIISKNQLDFI